MIYYTFTFLFITTLTCLNYPSWAFTNEVAKSTDTLTHEATSEVTPDIEHTEGEQLFAYQLKEDHETGLTLLLHLKEPVAMLEIHVYNPMGTSQCVTHEKNLERGFYYLPLPQPTDSQLHYWEVKFDSKRILNFVR